VKPQAASERAPRVVPESNKMQFAARSRVASRVTPSSVRVSSPLARASNNRNGGHDRSSSSNAAPRFATVPAPDSMLSKSLFAGLAVFAAGAAVYSAMDDEQKTLAAGAIEGVYGSNSERTFIAVKPDGVQRGLVGEIIRRFESRGYKLVGIRMVQPTEAFAKQHYADLSNKPFFPGLVKYFSSGPVVAMVFEGKGVIAGGRALVGATNPANAAPGSVRGDLCIDTGRNIIHGSDGKESAAAEIALWFRPNDVCEYKLSNAPWIYEKDQ